jgi:hypothetical protein
MRAMLVDARRPKPAANCQHLMWWTAPAPGDESP